MGILYVATGIIGWLLCLILILRILKFCSHTRRFVRQLDKANFMYWFRNATYKELKAAFKENNILHDRLKQFKDELKSGKAVENVRK